MEHKDKSEHGHDHGKEGGCCGHHEHGGGHQHKHGKDHAHEGKEHGSKAAGKDKTEDKGPGG